VIEPNMLRQIEMPRVALVVRLDVLVARIERSTWREGESRVCHGGDWGVCVKERV